MSVVKPRSVPNWLAVLSMLVLLLCACQQKNQQQLSNLAQEQTALQVVDVLGRKVHLSQPAQRIVVLFEASLDDLYMLGAGSAVIGIPAKIYFSHDLFQAYSVLDPRIKAKQIATPSNWEASSNIESLLALQPDLVVVSSGQLELIQLLDKMGIPAYAVQSENLQQTQNELRDLAVLTNTQQRAQQILDFIALEIQKLKASRRNMAKKTVYYAWSGGRIYSSSGQNSMINLMISLAGLQNSVTTAADQPNINPEKLLEWNPDIILLWNTDPALLYQMPELKFLDALKQHQVYNLAPSFFFNPHTPKILLGANQLQHWVDPNGVDLVQAANDKHRILTALYGAAYADQLLRILDNQ